MLFCLASYSESGVKHFGFLALEILTPLFVKFNFLQNLFLLMLIRSGNPIDILQPVFSLDHFHLFFDKSFMLSSLVLLLLLNFFLLPGADEGIDLFLAFLIHDVSHPFLILFTLNILLLLNLDLSLLFLREDFLSSICFGHCREHLFLLHELDILGILKDLFHLLLLFFALLFDFLLPRFTLPFKLQPLLLSSPLPSYKKCSLFLDSLLGHLLGLLDFSFFGLSFEQTLVSSLPILGLTVFNPLFFSFSHLLPALLHHLFSLPLFSLLVSLLLLQLLPPHFVLIFLFLFSLDLLQFLLPLSFNLPSF